MAALLGISVASLSLPLFWLALILKIFLSLQLGWLPPSGYRQGLDKYILLPAITLALPKRGDLRKLIELYQGEDTTMWASDWPHLERDLIAGFMRYDMSEAMRRKILGENAVRFFNLEQRK